MLKEHHIAWAGGIAAAVAAVRADAPWPVRVIVDAVLPDPASLRANAATGVDRISTSAPVSRAPWLDWSMRFTPLLGWAVGAQ